MQSTLRLSRVLATRSFHTSRIAAAEPGTAIRPTWSPVAHTELKWNHLVNPHTPKHVIETMQKADAGIAAMKADLARVPAAAPEIDWDAWDKKIDDKKAFAEIKATYEKQMAEAIAAATPKGTTGKATGEELAKRFGDVYVDLIHMGVAIAPLHKHLQDKLAEFRSELATAKKDRAEVAKWIYDDFVERFPGWNKMFRDEYMAGQSLPTDTEDRIAEIDIADAKRQVQANQKLPEDEDFPTAVGDWDLADRLKELAKFRRDVQADFDVHASNITRKPAPSKEVVSHRKFPEDAAVEALQEKKEKRAAELRHWEEEEANHSHY